MLTRRVYENVYKNHNPLIWKQFKAFQHFGFLLIPSNCQVHSCVSPRICCSTVWSTLPRHHRYGCAPPSPRALFRCLSLPLPARPAPLLFLTPWHLTPSGSPYILIYVRLRSRIEAQQKQEFCLFCSLLYSSCLEQHWQTGGTQMYEWMTIMLFVCFST